MFSFFGAFEESVMVILEGSLEDPGSVKWRSVRHYLSLYCTYLTKWHGKPDSNFFNLLSE